MKNNCLDKLSNALPNSNHGQINFTNIRITGQLVILSTQIFLVKFMTRKSTCSQQIKNNHSATLRTQSNTIEKPSEHAGNPKPSRSYNTCLQSGGLGALLRRMGGKTCYAAQTAAWREAGNGYIFD